MYEIEIERRSPLTSLLQWLVPSRSDYFSQQVDLLYQHLPLSQTVSLLVAVILVVAMHGVVPQPGSFCGPCCWSPSVLRGYCSATGT